MWPALHLFQAAVFESVLALKVCLEAGGCSVVPGLDTDHYAFTLIMSIAGGLVFGASTRFDPKGGTPSLFPSRLESTGTGLQSRHSGR